MRDWIPSPDDVGAVIRARTKDSAGNELGTFTEATRPTRAQVVELTDSVVARIQARCGNIPDEFQDFARRVAAVRAAANVELSYFPEQINASRSQYAELKAEFDETWPELVEACRNTDTDETTDNDSALSPIHTFPPIDCTTIGLSGGW